VIGVGEHVEADVWHYSTTRRGRTSPATRPPASPSDAGGRLRVPDSKTVADTGTRWHAGASPLVAELDAEL
jgi:hypothetical protein